MKRVGDGRNKFSFEMDPVKVLRARDAAARSRVLPAAVAEESVIEPGNGFR